MLRVSLPEHPLRISAGATRTGARVFQRSSTESTREGWEERHTLSENNRWEQEGRGREERVGNEGEKKCPPDKVPSPVALP